MLLYINRFIYWGGVITMNNLLRRVTEKLGDSF